MKFFKEYLISPSQNLRDALNLIEKNMSGICFISDEMKLVGSLTDGDIRRAMLNGASLDSVAIDFCNKECITSHYKDSFSEIQSKFSEKISHIPLIDSSGYIYDITSKKTETLVPILEPDLSGNESKYLNECIKSGWISSKGEYVRLFENRFAELHKPYKAVSTSSGTTALHLALQALGIKKGDEVIVPNLTFAATANAVLLTGASLVLVDINRETLCIDIDAIKNSITEKTKAIIVVHLYGNACRMKDINEIALKNNLLVVEDCAEALGSFHRKLPLGTFGDASIFSFYGNKTITTGEGGMAIFKSNHHYKKALIMRDHGMSPQKKYWHEIMGFNYRLTNMQAAIGVAQLEQLEKKVNIKIKIEGYYRKYLKKENINFIKNERFTRNSFWLNTFILNEGISREELMEMLKKNGIDSRPVFYPLSEMPPYKDALIFSSLENSINISKRGISLPSSTSLNEIDIQLISENFNNLIQKLI